MKKKQVFESVKVADFSWVGAGPLASRVLAEHGATVIRVESHKRPDPLRFMGPFLDGKPGLDRSAFGAAYNTNKYGITLDMEKPKGQEIAKKLMMWADVVTNSFTPGTMKRWGLDYQTVSEFRPDIVYYKTSQQGQWGPHANFSGYGTHAAALAGFFGVTGWPDRGPSLLFGAYIDYISPWYLAIALIAALDRRRKTGKGLYIEQSQLEAGVNLIGPALLDYFVNGRIAGRMGNRDPYTAPQGAFRCKGDDQWVTISVQTEEHWQAFCEGTENPQWTTDPRFSTWSVRKENEDELEKAIEAWTADLTPQEVMTRMQQAGIPAGVVQTSQDLFEDPQVRHRRAYEYLNHSVIGRHAYNSPAYRLSTTPWEPKKAAPTMGEDNEWVYKEILGLCDDEIADLVIEGIITTDADTPF
jgi:benzylsuccinate CoA-transferase BbsF subunit